MNRRSVNFTFSWREPQPALSPLRTSVLPVAWDLAALTIAATLLSTALVWAQTTTGPNSTVSPSSTSQAGMDSPTSLTGADLAAQKDGSLIVLPLFVLEKNEQPVTNLSLDGVAVQQDGHPETTRKLVRVYDQPLALAVLMDTRGNDAAILDKTRKPVTTLVDAVLARPEDRAAVVDFNDDAGLDLGLSSAHDKIKAAIDKLHIKQPNDAASSDDRNVNGNVFYDALFLASDEVLKDQPGRKIVIVMTDGIDRGSKESNLSAIEAAQRAHAVVYTIGFPTKELKEDRAPSQDRQPGGGYPGGGSSGGGYPGSGGSGYPGGGGRRRNTGGEQAPSPQRKDAKKVLTQISEETGGHYYEISSKLSVDQALASIGEQLKNEYVLTYTPTKEDKEEGFHRLQWTTKDKSRLLQAPSGFYVSF